MDRGGAGNPVIRKVERIRAGDRPRLLDFFAGCGGMTLGFVDAGCDSVGGVEADRDAVRSYSYNFHGDDDAVGTMDVTLGSGEIIDGLGIGHDPEDAVDIVVGGPPCPTFSRIGRAKINAVHADGGKGRAVKVERDLFDGEVRIASMTEEQQAYYLEGDSRNELYRTFIGHVAALKPVACLMENVPGFLNQGGVNHGALATRELEKLGYVVRTTILNAADHGVPQWRERFFLMAVHRDAAVEELSPPRPTHSGWRPDGLRMNRLIYTQLVEGGGRDHAGQQHLFGGESFAVGTSPTEGGRPFVTALDAMGDLPTYDAHLTEKLFTRDSDWEDVRIGAVNYGSVQPSEYAMEMRRWRWPGSGPAGLREHHHRTRHTMVDSGRDVNIFREMLPGDDYRDAMRIALGLLARERARFREREGRDPGGEELEAMRERIVPPYPVDRFPQKWWKIDPSMPVRTLTAHLGVDTYSHIHHDSAQARMITVQEAARLQSFPDRFTFRCGMNSAMRQIGNSVPPLLARALASRLLSCLGSPLVRGEPSVMA